jgi:ATP-dependent DNA helicase PIF1
MYRFPTRVEVERANNTRMHDLHGEVKVFEARDGGIADRDRRERILANCMAPPLLQLKVGSQVMLIKNFDDQLVNGSIGTIVGFMSEGTYDKIKDEEEEDGPPASTAAALSRYNYVDEAEDPELAALRKADRHSNAKIRSKIDALSNNPGAKKYPYVRFTLADKTTRMLLVTPEVWKVELPNGDVEAQRSQVPLILAWALSIHKAQGQTLEYVKVDLGKVFEAGQAYVALSRATSMTGLQVMRFDPRRVTVHDRVKSFYAGLKSAEDATSAVKPAKKQAAKSAWQAEEEEWADEFEEVDADTLKAAYGG